MTHAKPPSFACSRFVAIASIMWRSAHMTVVALEVAVHTHRNATPHQSVQLLAKGAPNPIRECIFLVRLCCAPLCAIEEANAFQDASALQHKYKVETHAGGCLNTHGNPLCQTTCAGLWRFSSQKVTPSRIRHHGPFRSK